MLNEFKYGFMGNSAVQGKFGSTRSALVGCTAARGAVPFGWSVLRGSSSDSVEQASHFTHFSCRDTLKGRGQPKIIQDTYNV